MWGRRGVQLLLLGYAVIALGAVLIVIRVALASDSAGHDAQLVFCLSGTERYALATAAVTLGLARSIAPGELTVAGRTLTPQQWQREHPADFDRACRALAAAPRQSGTSPNAAAGELWSIVTVLVSVIVGAFLTLVNGEWRASSERNRLQADALRVAARAFAQAADDYIAQWLNPGGIGLPADMMLRARRNDLVSQLLSLQAAHSQWTDIALLARRLSDGDLGDNMTRLMATQAPNSRPDNGPEHSQPAAQLRTAVRESEAAAARIAAALQREAPWRRAPGTDLTTSGQPVSAGPAGSAVAGQ
jgi:hypothetical protein